MARRRIGQERLRIEPPQSRRSGSLDEIAALIDWAEIDRHLGRRSGVAAAAGVER